MRYPITPQPKPRMTKADAWKNRPCVLKYRKFKDTVRDHGITIPVPCRITFIMPMPKSYTKKKRAEIAGTPHMNQPDLDNLLKAIFDCVFENDAHIWCVHASKFWALGGDKIGGIEIEPFDYKSD